MRKIGFFEVAFFVLFIIKGLGLKFFGSIPSWLLVFSPFLVSGVFFFAGEFVKSKNIVQRLRFFIWKIGMKIAVKKAGEKAAEDMKQHFKSSNPGQHYDAK